MSDSNSLKNPTAQLMHIPGYIKPFIYHGSKYSYLPWLLPLLPEAKHFVDVFGGSASVLLNRKPALIETYNDINSKVVNFFQVLRSEPDNLIDSLLLTPYSREEYRNAWFSEKDSAVEKARKFFIRSQQSIWAAGAQDQVKGWAASIRDSRVGKSEKVTKWINAIDGLREVYIRLANVQIENKCFRFILDKYDDKDNLFYLDSPYDQTFRSQTAYEFDFINQDFFDLHYYAKHSSGMVAISGYNSPFMKELFKDFNFHQGPKRKNTRSKSEAVECLWTNY